MSIADSYNLVEFHAPGSSGAVDGVGAQVTPPPAVTPIDLAPEFIIESLLLLRIEEHRKAKASYRTVKDIERAIEWLVREGDVKLPLHTPYGTVRKGYEADRYPNPKRFRLRARRTLIGPKKRMVIKGTAA